MQNRTRAALTGTASVLLWLTFPSLSFAHAEPCGDPLMAAQPQSQARFGSSIALNGYDLAVGAPQHDARGIDSGSVTTFRRTVQGWARQEPLLLPGDIQAGDQFGTSVAIENGTLAVGAPLAGNGGAVYLFRWDGASWIPEGIGKLTVSDAVAGARFGFSVALSNGTLVVGAPFDDGGRGSLSGSVYVFRRRDGQWQQEGPKLTAPDGRPHDELGFSIAVEGDTLVAGAPFADFDNRRNFGKAYVFQRSGTAWSLLRQPLTAGAFRDDDLQFGAAVALDSATLVVGAPGFDFDRQGNAGAAYTLDREGFSSPQANPVQLPLAGLEEGDQFGSAVAVRGNTLAVGAPWHDREAGAVFQYSRSAGNWSEPPLARTGNNASPDDRFGSAVAISDKEIIFGGPLDDVNNQADAGSVAVCRLGEQPTADLAIEKSDQPDPVCAGERLTYQIRVHNDGPSAVTGARVKDTFPSDPPGPHLRDVRWKCLGPTCVVTSGEGDIDHRVDLPVGGEVRYEVIATVVGGSGMLSNETAEVEAPAGVTDPDPDNNSPGEKVTTTVSAVDLALTTTDPIAVCGGDLRYTLTVTNRGGQAADAVEVVAETPPGLTPLPPPGCAASPAGHIVCRLGRVPTGRSIDLAMAFEIPVCFSGDVPIRAEVSTLDLDCDPANNGLDLDLPLSLDCSTAIGIEKSGPPAATPGGSLLYTVKVSNDGTNRACNVLLRDPIPSGLSSPVPPPGCTLAANEIRCPLGDLDPDEMRPFEFKFTVSSDAECDSKITNTATATADNAAAVSASAMTTVACCKLAISKTADEETAMPGQRVSYTIEVSNPGGSDVEKAKVEDFFPQELSDIRWCRDEGFPCTPVPAGDLLEEIDLPAGGSATYRAGGTVDIKFTGSLENTVTVTAPECEGVSATAATAIEFTGVKAFCISIDGPNVEGGMITYTFLLINGGPAFQADNPGDELTDTLPAGLTLAGVGADSGTPAMVGNMATWNGSIPVGGMVMITVTATIDAGTEGICNQAMIAFDADGDGINESMGLSDDPSLPGDADPCCFQVLDTLPIPAASTAGLAALALLLGALAWRRLRTRGP